MPTNPIKLVMSTLTYTILKAQSQHDGRGGTAVGTAEPHCQNPAAFGLGLISEPGRGKWGSTDISFTTRLHGICNASHNRMKEWCTFGISELHSSPTALGLGISAYRPCFRVSFGGGGGDSSVLSSATRLQEI